VAKQHHESSDPGEANWQKMDGGDEQSHPDDNSDYKDEWVKSQEQIGERVMLPNCRVAVPVVGALSYQRDGRIESC
jgi:hypothetical protein